MSFKKWRKYASSQLHAFIGQVHIQNSLHNTPKLPACIFIAREHANSRIIFAERLKMTGELCLADLVSMPLFTCQQSLNYQHTQTKNFQNFKKAAGFFLVSGLMPRKLANIRSIKLHMQMQQTKRLQEIKAQTCWYILECPLCKFWRLFWRLRLSEDSI